LEDDEMADADKSRPTGRDTGQDGVTPPSGSAQSAVKAPRGRMQMKWLVIAVAAVAAVLLFMWAIGGTVNEVGIEDVSE
jgi:hypothetical protein